MIHREGIHLLISALPLIITTYNGRPPTFSDRFPSTAIEFTSFYDHLIANYLPSTFISFQQKKVRSSRPILLSAMKCDDFLYCRLDIDTGQYLRHKKIEIDRV